ncbi:MAG: prenyltransferase/squalene oxidase repeat-containing protein [Verrucomicrobiota bacterium]
MNLPAPLAITLLFLTLLLSPLPSHAEKADLSLKLEIEHAIKKGLDWLRTQQDTETGAFGDPEFPALTALPACALIGQPSHDPSAPTPESLEKALAFILDSQHPDGGIYGEGLATYNTSLALLALSLAQNPDFSIPIRNARRFLIGQQSDYDTENESDNPFDGGVGYGGTYTHSDLSNTHFALEALYYSRKALADSPEGGAASKLNWDAAIKFVERCQNLTPSNDQPWATDDPEQRGGFIYFPGDSKAGTTETADGTKVFRSYGSMTYAGLLSFIYAEMNPDDPRVTAALDWLKAHFTVEENPGMEHQGLYYYYHTMAKALAISNIQELTLNDGSSVDWRGQLAQKLFDLQKPDGSWLNDTGRWWEKDPVLVTAYAVLTLEHIYHSIPVTN